MPNIMSDISSMTVLTAGTTIIRKEMAFAVFLLYDLHFSRKCLLIQSIHYTFLNFSS